MAAALVKLLKEAFYMFTCVFEPILLSEIKNVFEQTIFRQSRHFITTWASALMPLLRIRATAVEVLCSSRLQARQSKLTTIGMLL